MPELNARQKKFVDAYLTHGVAKQAAIDAGYSERNAESISSQLLKKTQVADAIAARQAQAAERADVTAERVIRELAVIAFSDLRDAARWNEEWLQLIPSDELTDDAARALREVVSTVAETEHGTTRRLHVRQHDKIAALRMLCQYLGLLKERVEVEHTGLGDIFEAIRRRARAAE